MNIDAINIEIRNLEDKLKRLHSTNLEIDVSNIAACFCLLSLKNIKRFVTMSDFNSIEEEINFFKNVKPKVYGKYLFYKKLSQILSNQPDSGGMPHRKYYSTILYELQEFFKKNLCFYNYYRLDLKLLDAEYYTRSLSKGLYPEMNRDSALHENFSSKHDITVARIIANFKLMKFIDDEIGKPYFMPLPQINSEKCNVLI